MKECRNKAPVGPKEKNQELYMKRHVDEREETDVVEERTEKREKGAETMESENTGGSSSSKVYRNPEDSENEHAESAKNKIVPNVKGPSRREREEHEETHCTYRSWCRHCVKGRGREDGHYRKGQDSDRPEIPTIAMDYCFMGKENKKPLTILVIKDNDSKAMKAFITAQKGSGDGEIVWKLQKLIDDQWGRRKIIMKADKEPSNQRAQRPPKRGKNR